MSTSMSAKDIVCVLLPILGFVNGFFMSIAPNKAAERIYKFHDKEIKPQIIDLVRANGVSAFSVAIAEMLLSFTSTDSNKAVAVATIPRVFFLIYSMASRTSLGATFLEPRNLIKILIATSLIEGKWLNPTLSMQVRGGVYILLGVLLTVAPTFVAKSSSEFDTNPTIERCFRARGKTDIVFGTLVYSLATQTYIEALGFACLAWFVSSLYADFVISKKGRFRSDAFVQLAIASVSAVVLLVA